MASFFPTLHIIQPAIIRPAEKRPRHTLLTAAKDFRDGERRVHEKFNKEAIPFLVQRFVAFAKL
jgi:hypothetical protein